MIWLLSSGNFEEKSSFINFRSKLAFKKFIFGDFLWRFIKIFDLNWLKLKQKFRPDFFGIGRS